MTSGGPGYASSTFTLYTIETAFLLLKFRPGLHHGGGHHGDDRGHLLYQNKIIHGIILKGGK